MKKEILLIDDERSLLEITAEMIEILGYGSFKAPNKELAINVFKQHQNEIKLVIIDKNLKNCDGIDLFCDLVKINSSFKAVLATGMSALLDTQEILDKGISEIIDKPYNMADLEMILKKYID